MPKKNSADARKKGPLIAILLACIAVGACAAAGYAWYKLLNVELQATAGTNSNTAVVATSPLYMPLDTFTVSLMPNDEEADRVLYIGLTLRLNDEASRDVFKAFLPEIRSRLLVLLSQQSADILATNAGKTALTEQIKIELNKPFDQRSVTVTDVLYNAFILR